jgi:hypothetical protein
MGETKPQLLLHPASSRLALKKLRAMDKASLEHPLDRRCHLRPVSPTTFKVHTSPQPQAVRFFLSYRETQPGQWELMGVYGGTQVDLEVSSGTWAFRAVGRGGAESQGVRISVP